MGDRTHIVELIDQVLDENQDRPQLQEKVLDLRDALFQAQQSAQQYALKIKTLEEAIEKLKSPAHRIGTILGQGEEGLVRLVSGGTEYQTAVVPELVENEVLKIGDQVEVYLEYIEDAGGNTILSKEKADFMRRWKELNDAFDNEKIIKGKIIRRIKGGLIVDLGVVQAFLPGSQVDVRPIQDFDVYLEKEIEL